MKSFPLIFSVTENIDDLVHQDEGNRVWKPQPMIYQCSAPVWSFRLSLPLPLQENLEGVHTWKPYIVWQKGKSLG